MNIYEQLDIGGPAYFRNTVNVTGDLSVSGTFSAGGTTAFSGSTIVLTPLAVAPTPATGMIYFNSVDSQFYGYNGTAWVIMG